MTKLERSIKIVNLINEQGYVTYKEFAEIFNISIQSSRRDIENLSKQGLVKKINSGACSINVPRGVEYSLRLDHNTDLKDRIAEMVVQQIPENTTVFISIGTTMEAFAHKIKYKKGMRYITNSLFVANILRENKDNEIFLPNGRLNNSNGAIYGASTIDYLSLFFPDFYVMSAASLTIDGNILAHIPEEISCSQKIRAQSAQAFFLFDHTKLSKKGTVYSCSISEFSSIFTDAPIPSKLLQVINKYHIIIKLCGTIPYN